jgi:hypothetical protein
MKQDQKEPIFVIIGVLLFSIGLWAIRSSYQPKILAGGEFHRVAHKGAGRAEIIEKTNGKRFLVLKNFRTSGSNDLYVFLISAPDALENETIKNSEIYSLGKLSNSETVRDEYPLPGDLDISAYRAVTIWNKKYQSNFTTAPLKQKADF